MTFQRFMRPVQAVSAAVLAFVAAGLIGAAAMVITEE
jgi:hypothetical protein